jgi:CheY-like chemotaxis protein/predicted RNA-binding Zn-ribbon protein involved in translation (DUF1610 family)
MRGSLSAMLDTAATADARTRGSQRAHNVRLLVVDDDAAVRTLYVALLEEVDGVGSVVAAADGAEAVRLARSVELDVAVLDLDMPRLDGVTAALELAALQPTLAIALQSSDPESLRRRAGALGFPLFDKVDFDRIVAWVEGEVEGVHRRAAASPSGFGDLSCARCGYGIATDSPPQHCPMCGRATRWRHAGSRRVGC